MNVPETRYAKTADGVTIAFQVVGGGAVDLVLIWGWVSNVELVWEQPVLARYLRRLASFSRLIMLDKRGTGLSDRVPNHELPSLETRMDDLRAVMDAAGSDRAVAFAHGRACPLAIVHAATHPDRTAGLILFTPIVGGAWSPDWPWGDTPEELRAELEDIERSWGTVRYAAAAMRYNGPSLLGDERFVHWFATFLRRSASPGAAAALELMDQQTDARDVLPTVRVPTLVINRADAGPAEARHVAELIPGAQYVEPPGADLFAFAGDSAPILEEVERFAKQLRSEQEAEFNRVLATVLFTDIVASTEKQASVGDRAWKALLERHHAVVRDALRRWRGGEVDTAGDGFLATFDGPARAVRCAQAIVEGVRALGLEVRAGLHTGEVEKIDDKIGGIAVNIGARVGAMAGPNEVLVSSTVKDLVAGSGLAFEDAGEHELKGVPDRWRLYRVLSTSA